MPGVLLRSLCATSERLRRLSAGARSGRRPVISTGPRSAAAFDRCGKELSHGRFRRTISAMHASSGTPRSRTQGAPACGPCSDGSGDLLGIAAVSAGQAQIAPAQAHGRPPIAFLSARSAYACLRPRRTHASAWKRALAPFRMRRSLLVRCERPHRLGGDDRIRAQCGTQRPMFCPGELPVITVLVRVTGNWAKRPPPPMCGSSGPGTWLWAITLPSIVS